MAEVQASSATFKSLTTKVLSASYLEYGLALELSDGVLYLYDDERCKRLSVSRSYLSFSLPCKNVTPIRWLESNGVLSNVSGINLLREATITGVSFQSMDVNTGTFEINEVINATVNNLLNLSIDSDNKKSEDNLDIDIHKDRRLEVKLISGEFSFPVILIETAWRNSS